MREYTTIMQFNVIFESSLYLDVIDVIEMTGYLHTHARTHTHAHTLSPSLFLFLSLCHCLSCAEMDELKLFLSVLVRAGQS